MDCGQFIESDCDDEMLLFIPFVSAVKIKKLILLSGEDGMAPNRVKLLRREQSSFFISVSMGSLMKWFFFLFV